MFESSEMGFFQKVLDRISDPNIAYMLMMLGFYRNYCLSYLIPGYISRHCRRYFFDFCFLFHEFYAGKLCRDCFNYFWHYSFFTRNKNNKSWPLSNRRNCFSFIRLYDFYSGQPCRKFCCVSWSVIFAATGVTALFFLFIVTMGLKAQRSKPVTGSKAFDRKNRLKPLMYLNPSGQVKIYGMKYGMQYLLSGKINENEKVIVKEIKGLTLYVERII